MPRPTKWRRVEFIPETTYFTPCVKGTCRKNPQNKEIKLKIEELEAIRLKDIEELNQEECAERMQISRPTFQNILNQARKKITTSLVEGTALCIEGGHYTENVCQVKCSACGNVYQVAFEEDKHSCKMCGAEEISCRRKRSCHKSCKCDV